MSYIRILNWCEDYFTGRNHMLPTSTLCWCSVRNFAIPQPLTRLPADIGRKHAPLWLANACSRWFSITVATAHHWGYRFGLNLVPMRDSFGHTEVGLHVRFDLILTPTFCLPLTVGWSLLIGTKENGRDNIPYQGLRWTCTFCIPQSFVNGLDDQM